MWSFIRWGLCVVPSLFMAVFGRLVAPILPFFVEKDTLRLPAWLDWFNTPHSTADGDRGHQERWPGNSPWQTYVRRVAWYLRNVCYGFDRTVVGVLIRPNYWRFTNGNPKVGDLSGVSGWVFYRAYSPDDTLKAWQFYAVYHYPIGRGKFKCVRMGAGWKIWGTFSTKDYAQFFLYFHPFKGSGRKA